MLKAWEAAYIAGIIDGEGTISFKNRNTRGAEQPVITITSTDFKMLAYIQSILPGSMSSKKMTISGSTTYLYSIEIKPKEHVCHALKQIKQFIRADYKKEQIDYVLEYFHPKVILRPRNVYESMYMAEQA